MLYNSSYMRLSGILKFMETENRMVVARSWEEGEMGCYCSIGTKF